MSSARGGRIITFYSYKGGTGRSMALSNLAWVLAANRKRVLLMDWDLEAPGLHRYFHPFLADKELTTSRGLVDLLADYADLAIQPPVEGEEDDWYRELTDLTPYLLGINFPDFPEGGRIDLLPAGRQGAGYADKLHAFDWDTFYERLGGGTYLEAVKARLRETYDYVLIDSRTGVSDTAGICTVQMPDVLVTMFTYNNQSIRGALAVAQSAADTRRRLYGQFSHETFRVFPVPSRADPFEVRKLQLRQAYARRLFAPLLDHMPEREHNGYWSAVEVPYNAFLNYEEVLSPLIFNPEDPKLPMASVLRLAREVTDGDVTRYDLPLSPEQKQKLLQAYEQVDDQSASPEVTAAQATTVTESPADALIRGADALLGQFSQTELDLAGRLLLRLVRLPRGQEPSGLKRLLVPIDTLPDDERSIMDRFVQARVLRLTQLQENTSVEVADEALLARWRQLIAWAETDKVFLEQRYWIQAAWEQWRHAGQPEKLLLADPLLAHATRLLYTHAPQLTTDEIEFIRASGDYRAKEEAREASLASVPPPPPSASAPAASLRRVVLPGWIYAVLGPLAVLLVILFVTSSSMWGKKNISQSEPPVLVAATAPSSAPTTGQWPPPQSQTTANEAAIGFNIAGQQSLLAGRLDEAIGNFSTALKLRPDFAEALFNRTIAYQLMKENDKAIADLVAGLKLRPDQIDAQLELARLLAESKDSQAAINQYQIALAMNLTPEQRQEAERSLERLNPTPDLPQVYLHINNRGDYAFAERLSTELKSAGSQVKGIQVLAQSTTADVRYANLSDERLARRLQVTVQTALTNANYPTRVGLLYIGNKYQSVPRGRIEIWLPPLTQMKQSGDTTKIYQDSAKRAQ